MTLITNHDLSISGYIESLFDQSNQINNTVSTMSGVYVLGYATKENLVITGSTLDNKIISLSGYAAGGLSQSGVTVLSYVNTTFPTIINLGITGSNLQSQINIITNTTGSLLLSSVATSTYSTILGLGTTGSVLDSKIGSLSGFSTSSFYLKTNPSNYSSSGNVEATGTSLQNQITTLSNNLTSTGLNISQVKVTGSSTVISPNFTGLGIIGVFLNGNSVVISGSLAAGQGESNTASSLGAGQSIFNQKVGIDLQFNSISGGTGHTTRFASNVIYIDSLPYSGNYILLNDVTGENLLPIVPNAMELYSKAIAGNDFAFYRGDYGYPVALGPSFWTKQINSILPSSAAALTTFGNAAVTLGTVSHNTGQYYGYMTNLATAAPVGSQAGVSFHSASLYRGNVSGNNGFFVTSRFVLPDGTGTYMLTGSTGAPGGFRLFMGVTDQVFSTMINTTPNPVGHYAGFQFNYATGSLDRLDTGWKFTYKNNNTQTVQDCNMPFDSGLYQAYIYMPPYPYSGSMFWKLEKYNSWNQNDIKISSVSGVTTGLAGGLITLPSGHIPLRAGIGIQNMTTAAKSIRSQILYTEV